VLPAASSLLLMVFSSSYSLSEYLETLLPQAVAFGRREGGDISDLSRSACEYLICIFTSVKRTKVKPWPY